MTGFERKTKETDIRMSMHHPSPKIQSPDPFLTHMLGTLSKHARLDLNAVIKSHDEVDHHYVEDAALALGALLQRRTADQPVARYGQRLVPMDDALVQVALDVGGRPYYEGQLPMGLYEHFLRSLAHEAQWTLHVDVRRGRDPHHVTEAAFKGVALAVRDALEPASEVQSTKGAVKRRGR